MSEVRAVKRNLVGLVMLGLGVALLACRAGETPSIATPSAQPVAVTATVSTAAATDIPTPPPSATATTAVVPTATPTPPVTFLVSVEGVAVDGTCVELDDAVVFPIEMFKQPDFEVEMEAYLNAGGAIGAIPGASAPADVDRAIRMQVVGHDVTGSGVPDLLIGVTIPYGGGDGETHLLFFTCVEGRYEGTVLFRRAGAGSRAEGLYEGGGVDVEAVGDMNGNGRGDVFFSVRWPGYGEHFLLEWEGGQFVSLIEVQGELGERRYWIETHGEEVAVVDVEGDGVYEIVVTGEGNGDEERVVWRWDGRRYSREEGE